MALCGLAANEKTDYPCVLQLGVQHESNRDRNVQQEEGDLMTSLQQFWTPGEGLWRPTIPAGESLDYLPSFTFLESPSVTMAPVPLGRALPPSLGHA